MWIVLWLTLVAGATTSPPLPPSADGPDVRRALRARAEALATRGRDLVRAARPDEAIRPLRHALRLLRRVDSSRDVALALRLLGDAYAEMRNEQRALVCYARAIARARDAADDDGVVRGICQVADLWLDARRPGRPPGLREALEAARRLRDVPLFALVLRRMGEVELAARRYSGANGLLRAALRHSERVKDEPGRSHAANLLGRLAFECGRFEEARRWYERPGTEPAKGAGAYDHALWASNLGVTLVKLGHYRRGTRLVSRAVERLRGLPDSISLAGALRARGDAFLDTLQFESARRDFEEAREILGDRFPMETSQLALRIVECNARLEPRAKQKDSAIFLRPVDRFRQLRFAPGVASFVLAFSRDADTASAMLEGWWPDPRVRATMLNNVGCALFARERHGASIEAFRLAIEICSAVGDTTAEAVNRYNIALAERARGRLRPALDALERASRDRERVRSGAAVLGEHARLAFATGLLPHLPLRAAEIAFEMRATEHGVAASRTAFEILERSIGATMRDLLAEAHIDLRDGLAPDRAERIDAHARRESELIHVYLQGGARRGRIRKELRAHRAAFSDLIQELRASVPAFAAVRYPVGRSAGDVRRALHDDEALVAYLYGPDSVHAFVLRETGLAHLRVALDADDRIALDLWRSEWRNGAATFDEARRQRFARLLLHDVEPIVHGERRLTIVPYGDLALVPFEALPTRSGAPAIESWQIRHVHSGSVLCQLKEAKNARRGKADRRRAVFALADPALGGGSGDAASESTRAHVRAIERLARSSAAAAPSLTILTGREATKRSVVEPGALASYDVIHFGCHGVSRPSLPGLIGLRLGPHGEEGGLLSLRDVLGLRLSAEVVTLAACETNVGADRGPEGVQSLARGFLAAGALSVVVTNARARAAPLAKLMERFYARLIVDGMPPAAALRAAKLACRADGMDVADWSVATLWGLGE